ncbi:MAG: HAD family hydrolase [Leptolyngbyaceae cyanobacterium]
MTSPGILALDFDGVLCDGLVEYFQTAWQAYCQLFSPAEATPTEDLAERFYPLRPVIETGWEMPILLHALREGIEDAAVHDHWSAIVQDVLQDTQIEPATAMAAVDGARDRWIQSDLEGWLSLHRFYPGVIEQLQEVIAAGIFPIIISTKEGRFIAALLHQAGVELPSEQIIGKEIEHPKTTTLLDIQQSPPREANAAQPIWFIEDRLKTLEKVKGDSRLAPVQLFLADWGYNTAADRQIAEQDSRIHLLSLAQFTAGFEQWM